MTLAERARAAAASYWTAGLVWAAMSALHWRWLWRSAHAGDVLSAYGAGLVVLGVLIGSRPYLKAGLRKTAVEQTTFRILSYDPSKFGGDADKAIAATRKARADEVMPGLIAERVIAVVVVVAGTLLNGWGTPLARRWGLPV